MRASTVASPPLRFQRKNSTTKLQHIECANCAVLVPPSLPRFTSSRQQQRVGKHEARAPLVSRSASTARSMDTGSPIWMAEAKVVLALTGWKLSKPACVCVGGGGKR